MPKRYPKVSIIIPLYVIVPRFFRDLKKFSKIDYPDYEILIISDKKINKKVRNVKFINTGLKRTGPAEKRDIAISKAKGEICAFIDDDAYPDPLWLKNAVPHFKQKNLAAVGGPGITPVEDGFWEQVTGAVYNSYFCGGPTQHRFTKAFKMYVKDYPAYNLIIRKDMLKKVGGYGSYFYGGEDTFLCLKLVNKGWEILYDPDVVVYHHRRKLFFEYFRQIANIGIHRGYFAKKYPETSRYLTYFLPSFLTFGFFSGLSLAVFDPKFRSIFIILFLGFYVLAVASVIRKTDTKKALLAGVGIIMTHLTYGVYFPQGFLKEKLVR